MAFVQKTHRTVRRLSRGAAAARLGITVVGIAALSGCKDLAGNATPNSGTLDPNIYYTPAGVQLQLSGLQTLFGQALDRTILGTGLITDELTDQNRNVLDQRQLPELTDQNATDDPGLAYAKLQDLRVQAELTSRVIDARQLDVPQTTRAELYALQGYAELLLNELYCSGIPLTTLDISGTIRYQPGSSRDSVYKHAISAFDSAIAHVGSEPSLMTLARVGKARAFLDLGQFAEAAQAVSTVPTADSYTRALILGYPATRPDGAVTPKDFGTLSVSDRKGRNGLPYLSDNDPRTKTTSFMDSLMIHTYYYPTKYLSGNRLDSVVVTVASGVEARLIEAEAFLAAGNTAWLTTLNALRTDGTYTTAVRADPVTGDSVGVDTSWNAGSGGVSGLAPVTDPGTAAERVDLVFAERARWLFLTGHREGDLRRLIRTYPGRSISNVYPVGRTPAGDSYGGAVVVPIPPTERINPFFQGCLDRLP